MSERKPTQEQIDFASSLCSGHPLSFKWGAEWAKNVDPWYYVSDGNLPNHMENNILIEDKLGNIDLAYYCEYTNDESLFEGENGSYCISAVKCWMPVPVSQK